MARFFHPLIVLLASLTRSQLARQIQYLKTENRILRSRLPRRVTVTAAEQRKLIKLGQAVGPALKHVITIVSYRTFLRWASGERLPRKGTPRGRPPTEEEICQLILHLARETGWGYTRILGELRKLGVRKPCRSTVTNILKAHGFDPGPKRGEGSWSEFIQIHAKTLWACDFLSKKIWTKTGLTEYFILFFIHIGSRKVYVSGMTDHPHAQWMAQQARNLMIHLDETGQEASYVIRDGDKKYPSEFDALLAAGGIVAKRITPRSPNLNAFSERWVQALKHECLDHFVVLGERHLRHIVGEFLDYYHQERPHQSLANKPLTGNHDPPTEGEVRCRERLGGLLKHFYRKVA